MSRKPTEGAHMKSHYEIEEWDPDGSYLTIIIRGPVDIKRILEQEEYEGLEILHLKFEGIERPDISSLFGIEVGRLTLRSSDALELDFSELEGMESGSQELWIGFQSIKELDLSPLRNLGTLSGVSIGGQLLEKIDLGSYGFNSIEGLSVFSATDTISITGFDKIPDLKKLSVIGEFREVELCPVNSENTSATLVIRKIPIKYAH